MITNMTLTMMTTMVVQGRPRKMRQLRKHRAPPLRCQGGYIFIFNGALNIIQRSHVSLSGPPQLRHIPDQLWGQHLGPGHRSPLC